MEMSPAKPIFLDRQVLVKPIVHCIMGKLAVFCSFGNHAYVALVAKTYVAILATSIIVKWSLPLADFGTVTFTGCSVTIGGPSGSISIFKNDVIDMFTSSGTKSQIQMTCLKAGLTSQLNGKLLK